MILTGWTVSWHGRAGFRDRVIMGSRIDLVALCAGPQIRIKPVGRADDMLLEPDVDGDNNTEETLVTGRKTDN